VVAKGMLLTHLISQQTDAPQAGDPTTIRFPFDKRRIL
jgi:hypothetical protein